MKKIPSFLGLGPMSKEIINSIYSYSDKYNILLMLIASKNQIDYASGYVSTTKEFANYCKSLQRIYPGAKVLICRDHCGPGFNGINSLKDVYKTIDDDIENNFDIIHIDFCHFKGSRPEMLGESKKAIEHILNKKNDMMIEIGTDINSGKDFKNIARVEREMAYFSSFCKPTFFVCQTGTVIKEINQMGQFDRVYAQKLRNIADKFGFSIKEHNADYLNASDIILRTNLIDAMNIAPQLGVLQTMLTLQKAKLYGIHTDDFLNDSYKSKKWKKWLHKATWENKLLCSLLAGHYCFNSISYKKIKDKICKHENFDKKIEEEIHNLINLYVSNFAEIQDQRHINLNQKVAYRTHQTGLYK